MRIPDYLDEFGDPRRLDRPSSATLMPIIRRLEAAKLGQTIMAALQVV